MLFQITIPIAANIGTDAPLDLGPYISNIVGAALTLAAVATLIFLVMGGVLWITAGGDEKKIESARNRITGALIGLAIVAVSWALFVIIDNFLGIGIAGGTSTNGGNPPAPQPGGTVGNASCVCGGAGGCAATGTRGSMNFAGTECYTCTDNGWAGPEASPHPACPPIHCGSCPTP